jgi:hypothetical protein
MHVTEAPAEVVLERLRVRNNTRSEETFFIPEAKLREWMQLYEPLAADELASSRERPIVELCPARR